MAAIIYAASLALVFAILISVLCAFLYTYENNLPIRKAEDFVLSLDRETLASLVEKTAGELGEFENAELLIEKTEHLSGKISTAKLAKEYTSERPVYRLICGDKDIGKIILRKSDKNAAFGLTAFELDEVLLYPESVPGAIRRTSVTVCLPKGATLYVNDKAVGEEYITENGISYSGKTVVPEGTECDIYKIEGLCLVPAISAKDSSENLSLNIIGGKADWFSEDINSFVITAPSDASIIINGASPSSSLAGKGELTEALSEFEKNLGDTLPKALSYRVYGSYGESEISVSANGKALTGDCSEDEKNVFYLYSDESKYNVKVTAPKNAAVYINGVEVTEKYTVGDGDYESLTPLKKYSNDANALKGVVYEVRGLICEPQITAKIDSNEISLCSLKKNELTLTAEFYGAESVSAKNANSAAVEFTKAYFHYVANGAVGIEENYGALIAKMKSQSPAFKQIQKSKGSFEFVNQGVYSIDLLNPKNFIDIGGLIYCEVDYSVEVRFYSNKKLYEGTLSLVFIKENGTYLVCDMVIDSES